MIPHTSLRLVSMLRSMQATILPAIDPGDSLAQEQARLMIGHLNALIKQNGREPSMAERELTELVELANKLAACATGGNQLQSALKGVKESLQQPTYQALSLAVETLMAATDADENFKRYSQDLVIAYGKAAAGRGNQWFEPMGFSK